MKQIIEGSTGCGKTYHTVNKAKGLGKFIYLAPCRQLAYEVFIDYSIEGDTLQTGEVFLKGSNPDGNVFTVYENISENNLAFQNAKSIIIDEAHFITDPERGGNLVNIIKEASTLGLNIFLVTATRNFRSNGFEVIKLSPIRKPPKKVRVDYDHYIKNISNGLSTIEFVMTSQDAELSAQTLPSERIRLQMAFRRGEIKFITSTNVLAQGINMPCENMNIWWNPWEDTEILVQKLGRLGRLGFSNAEEVYYCISDSTAFESKKKIVKKKKPKFSSDIITVTERLKKPIVTPAHMIPYWWNEENVEEIEPNYNSVRYSRAFLQSALQNGADESLKPLCEKSLDILDFEAQEVIKVIKSEMAK